MLLMLYLGGHSCFFFFNDTATTEIYTLSLHDALPILSRPVALNVPRHDAHQLRVGPRLPAVRLAGAPVPDLRIGCGRSESTRLNSSHSQISYAVFCLKKKTNNKPQLASYHSMPIVLKP